MCCSNCCQFLPAAPSLAARRRSDLRRIRNKQKIYACSLYALFTLADISSLENGLGVNLPASYREVLQNYPFGLDSGAAEWDLYATSEQIKAENKEYRTGGFFGQPWPKHYLVIGGDGAGNPYFLDLSQEKSPVYMADHETTSSEDRLAVNREADDIEVYVRRVAEIEREAEQEWRFMQEQRRNAKWWQIWKKLLYGGSREGV